MMSSATRRLDSPAAARITVRNACAMRPSLPITLPLAPSPSSALPPQHSNLRLHRNAFRGEPAISEFDWHFTSSHSSSPRFVTLVGAGFHEILLSLHPGHGSLTQFRVYSTRLDALLTLAFASAPFKNLTSPRRVSRRLIMQKACSHPEGLLHFVGT